MDHKHEAVKLATYYFRLIAREAGINWDSDNNAEIEALVDFIIDAAVKETLKSIPTSVLE